MNWLHQRTFLPNDGINIGKDTALPRNQNKPISGKKHGNTSCLLMPMEKYWPHSRVPCVLPSAVSSSKAEDGAQVTRSGALFRTLDGSLNAHGPDPPFSTLSTTRPLPSPPSSNRSVSAEPGGSWAYGKLGTSEASGCVWGSPPVPGIWRRGWSFGVWLGMEKVRHW